MPSFDAFEAKNKLDQLLDLVENGKEVLINGLSDEFRAVSCLIFPETPVTIHE